LKEKQYKLTVCGTKTDIINEIGSIIYMIAKGFTVKDTINMYWKLEVSE